MEQYLEQYYKDMCEISGNVVSVRHYGMLIKCPDPQVKSEAAHYPHPRADEELTGAQSDNSVQHAEKERSVKEAARRARKTLTKLINLNFSGRRGGVQFLTLTFETDVTPQAAWQQFREWRKGRQQALGDLRYVCIMELTNRGRPHFHLICSGLPDSTVWYAMSYNERQKPFYWTGCRWSESVRQAKAVSDPSELPSGGNVERRPASVLMRSWRRFVEIEDVTDVKNIGAYLTKYLTKEFAEGRVLPEGITRYSASRNLQRVATRYYNEDTLILEDTLVWLAQNGGYAELTKPVIEYEFQNDYVGKGYGRQYVLNAYGSMEVHKVCAFLQNK